MAPQDMVGDRQGSRSIKLRSTSMASLQTDSAIDGASRRRRRAGKVPGLASSREWEAVSGSNHASPRTKLRAATWNVGTLSHRSAEIVETLTRRGVDFCGIQEHRWKGGLAPNQARLLKGKDSISSSFSAPRSQAKEGRAYYWLRNGSKMSSRSSASLTGSWCWRSS